MTSASAPDAKPARRYDVYGHFKVVLRPGSDGWWRAVRVGTDGKLGSGIDVCIPIDAGDGEIIDLLEIAFHEAATPESKIRRIG